MFTPRTALLSLALLWSPAVSAHGPGHGHGHGEGDGHGHHKGPVTEETLRKREPKAVAKLIEQGKLGPTWKDATLKTVEPKEIKGDKIWLVTFENLKEEDKTKQTFFMFFTLAGELVAANFTGK